MKKNKYPIFWLDFVITQHTLFSVMVPLHFFLHFYFCFICFSLYLGWTWTAKGLFFFACFLFLHHWFVFEARSHEREMALACFAVCLITIINSSITISNSNDLNWYSLAYSLINDIHLPIFLMSPLGFPLTFWVSILTFTVFFFFLLQ